LPCWYFVCKVVIMLWIFSIWQQQQMEFFVHEFFVGNQPKI
jgi:hypothetical protein